MRWCIVMYLSSLWRIAIAQLVDRWTIESINSYPSAAVDKKFHHHVMASMNYFTFSWALIIPSRVLLICDIYIHFCLSLGVFINKYVQKCIAWPWIISQSDITNMKYISFQHTIIGSSHTIRSFRIMHFFLIIILLVDD